MLKRLLPIVAVVLAGVLAIAVLADLTGGGSGGPLEEKYKQGELLRASSQKFREARTATVSFEALVETDIRTGRITWSGQSRYDFADPKRTVSDTEFDVRTEFTAPVKARRLVPGSTYYSSPSFVPADRKPWIHAGRTSVQWPALLADPELGLPDWTFWQSLLDQLTVDDTARAVTDELDDIEGAPHEFEVTTCLNPAETRCLSRIGTTLRLYLDLMPVLTVRAWLDDDGRMHRAEIRAVLDWDREKPDQERNSVRAFGGTYEFGGTFTFGGYGEPMPAVEPPPRDQISQEKVVNLPKN